MHALVIGVDKIDSVALKLPYQSRDSSNEHGDRHDIRSTIHRQVRGRDFKIQATTPQVIDKRAMLVQQNTRLEVRTVQSADKFNCRDVAATDRVTDKWKKNTATEFVHGEVAVSKFQDGEGCCVLPFGKTL